MLPLRPLVFLLFMVNALSLPAWAQDAASGAASYDARVDRIVFGAVRHNFKADDSSRYREGLRLEWRMASLPVWRLHPWLGVEFLAKQAFWGGAGLETDIDLTDRIVLTLQTGIGYFDDGTQFYFYNRYPHSGLKFRSQVELGYEIIDNGPRLALGLSHTSNAGLQENNSGINALSVNVHVPLQ